MTVGLRLQILCASGNEPQRSTRRRHTWPGSVTGGKLLPNGKLPTLGAEGNLKLAGHIDLWARR